LIHSDYVHPCHKEYQELGWNRHCLPSTHVANFVFWPQLSLKSETVCGQRESVDGKAREMERKLRVETYENLIKN